MSHRGCGSSANRKLARNGLLGNQRMISAKPTSGPESLPVCPSLSPISLAHQSIRSNRGRPFVLAGFPSKGSGTSARGASNPQ